MTAALLIAAGWCALVLAGWVLTMAARTYERRLAAADLAHAERKLAATDRALARLWVAGRDA